MYLDYTLQRESCPTPHVMGHDARPRRRHYQATMARDTRDWRLVKLSFLPWSTCVRLDGITYPGGQPS